jgi:MFS family permease
VILAAFLVHQRRLSRRGGSPLLELGLFAGRTLNTALLAQLVFWCGQASFFLVLALYLQQGRGLGAIEAGLVFTILAAAYLATSLGAPALTVRHGRRVLASGAATLVAGHLTLMGTVGLHATVLALAPGLLLVGAGMGLAITPLTTIILTSAPPEHGGAASGVMTTLQNVGNAIGVAVIGVIFFGRLHAGISDAFQLSLVALAVILFAVLAITRLLPAPQLAPHAAEAVS